MTPTIDLQQLLTGAIMTVTAHPFSYAKTLIQVSFYFVLTLSSIQKHCLIFVLFTFYNLFLIFQEAFTDNFFK